MFQSSNQSLFTLLTETQFVHCQKQKWTAEEAKMKIITSPQICCRTTLRTSNSMCATAQLHVQNISKNNLFVARRHPFHGFCSLIYVFFLTLTSLGHHCYILFIALVMQLWDCNEQRSTHNKSIPNPSGSARGTSCMAYTTQSIHIRAECGHLEYML